jgi:hypothetical protein
MPRRAALVVAALLLAVAAHQAAAQGVTITTLDPTSGTTAGGTRSVRGLTAGGSGEGESPTPGSPSPPCESRAHVAQIAHRSLAPAIPEATACANGRAGHLASLMLASLMRRLRIVGTGFSADRYVTPKCGELARCQGRGALVALGI